MSILIKPCTNLRPFFFFWFSLDNGICVLKITETKKEAAIISVHVICVSAGGRRAEMLKILIVLSYIIEQR